MSKLEMLSPENHAIALVDYQPAMYQGVQSHDRLVTFNNVQVLAKAAKLFGVPTIVTAVAQDTFPDRSCRRSVRFSPGTPSSTVLR